MEETCHICGEALVAQDTASCNLCYRNFHLAMTVTSTTKDCGQIHMDNNSLALAFVCNECLEQVNPEWSRVS